MQDEPLVIPLHTPFAGKLFVPVSVVVAVASVAWFVLAPSFKSILIGGVVTAFMVHCWGYMLTTRRVARGGPRQIVADHQGIRAPMWSISWDHIEPRLDPR